MLKMTWIIIRITELLEACFNQAARQTQPPAQV